MSSYRVDGLGVRYGGVVAVRDVSFDVPAGGALAIVGHNGAGKSSTLLALTGCLPRGARGTGRVAVPDVPGWAPLSDAARWFGRSMVPEREKVFPLMSVHENLLAASRYERHASIRVADVYGFFPRLAERRTTLAGNLSGGEQQMLAIGSALLGTPRMLLVDEPTLGLAVPVIEQICTQLGMLRRGLGLSLIVALAETAWVAELAQSAIVLDRGEIVGPVVPASTRMRDELEARLTGSVVPPAGTAPTVRRDA